MTKPVDKDSLPLNQPRRTPSHPTKSHIVKTKVDGKEKIIRFGQQGASTAGKPKEGESDRMKAKRASFKARHSANIAKGPASAAYWANKVKWADGGSVEVKDKEGVLKSLKKMLSLDSPRDMTTGETAADLAAGFIPGVGTALSARDFERARREDDKLGMALSSLGMIPVVGGMTRVVSRTAKGADELADVIKEQKMLQGFYRGYAGENPNTAELFVSPQKKVADYYANKRAMQTGEEPHAEMVLIDQLSGKQYGHSTLGTGKNPPIVTQARKIKPEDIKGRTKLYAEGGSVSEYDPFQVDEIMNSIDSQRGYAEGGSVNFAEGGSVSAYDPDQIDAIANQFM